MSAVAGVDGCKGGWVAAFCVLPSSTITFRVVPTFRDVLALPASHTTVDIPIGLLASAVKGGRHCERLARALLGHPRRNSVFSAPVRGALSATSFAAACKTNQASSNASIKVSQQAFALFPKLRDVDNTIKPGDQTRVFEVHPELCFYEMAGGIAPRHRKKSRAGRVERTQLLVNSGLTWPQQAVPGAAQDDILDALAACWTALRLKNGQAVCLPSPAPLDARGLRMELWR